MNTKQIDALKLARDFISAEWGFGGTTDIEPSKLVRMLDEALAEQPAQQQEPVAIEYWLQDTMESGRWVTTDNMAKATAEKMLSGEYGDVYPQGRIVEPSPPASKPLTDEEIKRMAAPLFMSHYWSLCNEFARAIEAKLREKNT